MKNKQNIFDNNEFFDGYKKLRDNKDSANELIEKPALFSMCPDLTNKVVLDLGCGYGENAIRFIELGAKKVVGIDVSEKMLTVAQKENSHDDITYRLMDMTDLDLLNERFDVVFSSLAVHYVKDFAMLLSKINNCLTEQGIFIFSQEHPLTTAPIHGVNWCKDSKGKITHYQLADYKREGQREVNWMVDGIIKYHRSFSTIFTTLIDNHFIVEKVEEPVPDINIIKRLPNYGSSLHKPCFLIIRAKKYG